ncbi:MAG TPA: hypothetical protein VJN19_01055 [Propionibacteriaceae bacterium]|nr:hypothetical protein [Propionibacteriaceae bacterium]
MVDQESKTYRPRRALIEPDAEPAQPERPAQPHRNGTRLDRNGARPVWPPMLDAEQPKPLYRDDVRPNGWSTPASRAVRIPEADPPTEETMRPIGISPRRPSPTDDETTTILPRSRPTKHRTRALDAIDDYDDDDERGPLSRHAKLAVLIGAVAVVVVIGLVVGYAVLAGRQPHTQPSLGPSTSGVVPPDQTATALLNDESMLNPAQAEILDRDRTWKVVPTQPGANDEDAPTAACFGSEAPEGQPSPQQKIIRVLSSSGKKSPSALHEATAYHTVEDAGGAYMIAAKTLGGCAVAGSYIESGHVVSGVGEQAVGVVIMEVDGDKTRAHSVVLNRSGRVVNLVDAAQPSRAIAIGAVAKALAKVNKVQCRPAGGDCGGAVSVKDGPPPLGGDEPGFLATGDLPPAGAKVDPWVATDVEMPKEEFQGSQCENVNWATVSAESKSSRVYLIQESGKDFFGLNEIVLTMKNAKAASKQVDTIKSSLASCKTRRLTASVSKPDKVSSIGARSTKVTGWTTDVSQKSTQGTVKYRVGIVSAGPKVIYTFLNPRGDYDFTGDQWDTVAVRAGERATQVD